MVKILIVDDELLGRMTIRSCVKWGAYGYEICGECSDGDQAIQMIQKLQPQVVITDIKMNRMNGDELVRYIAQHYPQICVIAVSSYDDYKYVRDVLKNKAIDYLIKNDLTEEVMVSALKKAENILQLGPTIKKNEDNLYVLRKQFICNLLNSNYYGKEAELENGMNALAIRMDINHVIPMLIVIPELINSIEMKERMLTGFSVCNVLEELVQENYKGIVTNLNSTDFLMLFSFDYGNSTQKKQEGIYALVSRCTFCLEKYLKLSANFHVGKESRLIDIGAAYAELDQTRKSHFLDVDYSVMPTKEYNFGKGLELEQERRIRDAVKKRNPEEVRRILTEIFTDIEKNKIERSGCSYLFDNLVIVAVSICKKYDLDFSEIYKHSVTIMEYVKNLERLKKCEDFFRNLFEKIIKQLAKMDSLRCYSAPVKKAIAYIYENYSKSISLSNVAEGLQMNYSYLSTLFKTEVGIGFSEYLNNVRLEKAKEMLDSGDQKLKKIATDSGFVSYSYFLNMFKKKYGVTPTEYQQNSF